MIAKTVVILGTMDTKGDEFAYLKKLIEGHGVNTLIVDSGVLEEPKHSGPVTLASSTISARSAFDAATT